jgi:acetyl-CoA carboxylase beta subunit
MDNQPEWKQGPAVRIMSKCTKCEDSEMFEDIQDGNLVCRECGLCKRLLISEDFN